jgi:hypothetical protein
MVSCHRPLRGALLVSATALGLLATAPVHAALSGPEAIRTANPAAAVNPGRAGWALLPLGLALLGWAGLRGTKEGAAAYGAAGSGSADAARVPAHARAATTGTTTSRNILVEASAHDGAVEVHERADIATRILRRVRNGERLALTGHRLHDWLEVATGGWVRDSDVRYDRNVVRFC